MLADEDNDKSSGFGEGSVSINKSCVSNVGCKIVGLGDVLKGQLGGMMFFRIKMYFKQYNER